jgi:AcrR family transcriptional regulator
VSKSGRPKEPWKRDHIIDSAIPLFNQQGLWTVSIQEIADAAGVSRASIHYHFDGVDGIILGVAEKGFEFMFTRRQELVNSKIDPREKLVSLINLGIPDEIPPEYIIMYESIGVFRSRTDFLPLAQNLIDSQLELYVAVLQEGVDAGIYLPQENLESIGKNLLAIEDASGIYLTLGTVDDTQEIRNRMLNYVSLALGYDLLAFSLLDKAVTQR